MRHHPLALNSLRWASTHARRHRRSRPQPRAPPRRALAADASAEDLDRYCAHWSTLLRREHEEDRRAEAERLQTWDLGRLVRSGYTLTGLLGGRHVGRQFSRDIVRFDAKTQSQTFSAGNEAILSRHGPVGADGELRDDALRVEICEISPSSISVSIAHVDGGKDSIRGAPSVAWRLDRASPAVAHERTYKNLQAYTSPGASSSASPALRRLLVRRPAGNELNPPPSPSTALPRAAAPSRLGSEAAQSEVERSLLLSTAAAVDSVCAATAEARGVAALNGPQRAAVVRALVDGSGAHPERPKVTLIQGPPGTGKTSTACALLQMAAIGADGPLLAAADSNTAVDQLLEGLLRRGVRALRLGRPSRPEPRLLEATIDAAIEAHPEHPELARERVALQQAARLQRTAALSGGDLFASAGSARHGNEIRAARKRLRAREAELSADVIASADVVCATLVGCGGPEIAKLHFPLVVVDEASQATEPRCLLAL